MNRVKAAGLIGGIALALGAALTPAASAQSAPLEVTQIRNLHYGECLAANGNGGVHLRPCSDSPLDRWTVARGGIGQIRNLATQECLEDINTSHSWGDAVLRPCAHNPRQLWEIPGTGSGYITNFDTHRVLKANHNKVVYVGAREDYYPLWEVR